MMMRMHALPRRTVRLLAGVAAAATLTGAAGMAAGAQQGGPAGSVAAGQFLYAARCSFCHGSGLDGNAQPGRTYPALVGPHTVPDYPSAAVLYDYIKRSMPYARPGSLSEDDTLSIVAYLLNQNGLLADDAVLDRATLASMLLPGSAPLPPPIPGEPDTPQEITPGSTQAGPVTGTR